MEPSNIHLKNKVQLLSERIFTIKNLLKGDKHYKNSNDVAEILYFKSLVLSNVQAHSNDQAINDDINNAFTEFFLKFDSKINPPKENKKIDTSLWFSYCATYFIVIVAFLFIIIPNLILQCISKSENWPEHKDTCNSTCTIPKASGLTRWVDMIGPITTFIVQSLITIQLILICINCQAARERSDAILKSGCAESLEKANTVINKLAKQIKGNNETSIINIMNFLNNLNCSFYDITADEYQKFSRLLKTTGMEHYLDKISRQFSVSNSSSLKLDDVKSDVADKNNTNSSDEALAQSISVIKIFMSQFDDGVTTLIEKEVTALKNSENKKDEHVISWFETNFIKPGPAINLSDDQKYIANSILNNLIQKIKELLELELEPNNIEMEEESSCTATP